MEAFGVCALPWELSTLQRNGQLLSIANTNGDERAEQRRKIEAYLSSHPTLAAWQAQRPRRELTPHFIRYCEETKRSTYDEALTALEAGSYTPEQLELVQDIGAEVAHSSLVLREGLILLSGTFDRYQLAGSRYSGFLWATPSPVTAIDDAPVLAASRDHKPTVFVLHLERRVPALFGHRRSGSGGYALLLPRYLRAEVLGRHVGERIDICDVVIG
jgi:hypothetical protein